MAQLAIKGHPTRGKEVIEILEMLGGRIRRDRLAGNELFSWYYINGNGYIDYKHYSLFDDTTVLILEEFLKKFPYKVGDKVIYENIKREITKMVWEEHTNTVAYKLDDKLYCNVIKELQPYKEETMEVSEEFFNKYCIKCGSQRCTAEGEWLEECKHYKEETMEETKKNLDWHPTDYLEFVDNDEWADEVELNLGNSYEIQVRDGQTFAIKKQPQYPKTCEECLKILGKTMNSLDNMRGYKYDLFMRLQQLLISREAYWKIAGEQMGLGKPWEPDVCQIVYSIGRDSNKIGFCNNMFGGYFILEFPTAEMRDAFYENFKELVEQCKELL